MRWHPTSVVVSLAVLAAVGPAQRAPRVVSMQPENGSREVDAAAVTELVVKFDEEMNTSGFSWCGGGPSYPKTQQARWRDKRTCVLPVTLEPDHDYSLSVNCPAARNFRSATGVPVAPQPWRFTTLPVANDLDAEQQRELNKHSLAKLVELLPQRYSYYEHSGVDWTALFEKRGPRLVAAKSTAQWAARAAKMLRATNDLHMSLLYGKRSYPVGSRRVDTLMRWPHLERAFDKLENHGGGVWSARTHDRIGFLLIGTFGRRAREQLSQVPQIIAKMKDCSTGLVLDVRPNSGGDELLARDIAACFVKGEKVYAKNAYRSKTSKTGFGRVLERKLRGNEKTRFPHPVVVLMGPGNMSSAEAFLLMMKQAENATLIGAKSYGSSGNPKPHKLPNDVLIYLPSWKALRPDGTCFEKVGLDPDIAVVPTRGQLDKGDPILERALAVLRVRGK